MSTRAPVNSVAAVKRIPIGTKLRIVRNMGGPCNSGRIVAEIKSNEIGLRIDDPESKFNGQVSYLQLKGSKIEPRENGFAVLDDGEVNAEYIFAEG